MKKPKTKGENTRAQIIEGAIRSLAQTGVVGTTTRKIATEAGVQLATLHYHFDSKSALLVAVLEHLVEDMAVRFREKLETKVTNFDEAIEQLLRGIWHSIMRTKSVQIVQYELTLYALREGANWMAERQYDAFFRLYRDWLLGIPEELRRFSSDDCAEFARFLLAGVDGLILQELANPNARRSKRSVEAFIVATKAYARELGGAENTIAQSEQDTELTDQAAD
jgi:AcrR family transcriptional regulator